MRSCLRICLTVVACLGYVAGGVIAPVAHHHHEHHGDCCPSSETAALHQRECSDSSCPFGHANCGRSRSEEPASKAPVPTAPHKDCAACKLLYMATAAVEFVSLPNCQAAVTQFSVQHAASALTGDIAFPAQRGPPASV